ncbi:MAG: hypothetical protein GKR94_00290 [Gammaproteobacteria bacterium]|nr:hypothetical protein [Gammaproteobacteria bacterium]
MTARDRLAIFQSGSPRSSHQFLFSFYDTDTQRPRRFEEDSFRHPELPYDHSVNALSG